MIHYVRNMGQIIIPFIRKIVIIKSNLNHYLYYIFLFIIIRQLIVISYNVKHHF